jgi:hypothetical protein
VEGRFLSESTLDGLRSAARVARDDGLDAVFVGDSPLGDAITLAAALCTWSPDLLIGVRLTYGGAGRQPSLVAREMSTLDQLAPGRTLATLAAPFADDVVDVLALWRTLWVGGPRIALDLTADHTPSPALLALADLALVAPTGVHPAGIDVCQILNA